MKMNSLGTGPKKKKGSSAKRVSKGKSVSRPTNDLVADASFDAKMMQKAGELMKTVPDVREEKVRELKKKIKDGTYKVDAKKTADRLVEEHLKVNFEKKR